MAESDSKYVFSFGNAAVDELCDTLAVLLQAVRQKINAHTVAQT